MARKTIPRIDLNADVGEAETGEGWEREAALLPLVSSVNVSCGAHAGTEESIRRIVRAAPRHGVAVGAHPGYPDREAEGRRAMAADPAWVAALVADQVRALIALAREYGVGLTHAKPHGALYNQPADDSRLAAAIARGVQCVAPALRLVGLAGSALLEAGRDAGLAVTAEAFADRRYTSAGRLVPRSIEGALITSPELAARQALDIVRHGAVTSAEGVRVPVRCDTLCVHGDTPGAVAIARAVRGALETAGIAVLAAG